MTQNTWKYFLGNGQSNALKEMPDAPAWRTFMSEDDFEKESKESQARWKELQALAQEDVRGIERGESFHLEPEYTSILDAVNASLHLRRPLLVTGKPGSGKTSLAYAVAHELELGSVLTWPVNTRSSLSDVLYRYDAVARLQDAQLKRERSMGDYLRLGPVGTAFLPSKLPRVLLIDEIDKCDINLPNDLLNLFEEGRFEIPELVRLKEEVDSVQVRTADQDISATIRYGQIFCYEFPFVIMTSNGEREFPPAFLRRCLRLNMPDPTQNKKALESIVEAHLKKGKDTERWQDLQDVITSLVERFMQRGEAKTEDIATDQLLNVVYLLTRQVNLDLADEELEQLQTLLLKGLSEEP